MEPETIRNLVCPKCSRFFATMETKRWPDISCSDIKIVAGTRKKLKDGDSLACSLCRYEFNTHDVILAAASPPRQEKLAPGQKATI